MKFETNFHSEIAFYLQNKEQLVEPKPWIKRMHYLRYHTLTAKHL